MAKVEWKTTPKSAYEWVELTGGGTMSSAEQAAYLDEYIEDNGLVPVETTFVGETPIHKYGRYKADFANAQALAPTALPGRENDLMKANAELDRVKQELARAMDQLGKKKADKSNVVTDDELAGTIGGGSVMGTDEARETLNQTDGVNLVAASEEVRQSMASADRSDNNPKLDDDGNPEERVEPKRGRPKAK